ncbi:globin-coupled sensor protein [Oceanicaulis alexandrii]|uniref:protoglobin domain-containing protein n=1 Tax=Oceanicaulis alexandrii TaxID=153233 RepID=UPI0035D0A5CF
MSYSIDFKTRIAFMKIEEEERQLLRNLKPVIEREFPGILDAFYEHLKGWPEIYGMFGGEAGVKHARSKQLEHWLRIADAKFDEDYARSVTAIGNAHARLKLQPQWYFGAYNFLMMDLIQAVLDERRKQGGLSGWRGHAEAARKRVSVLVKAVMLDMELVLSVIYERQNEERLEMFDTLANEMEAQIGVISDTLAKTSTHLADSARTMAKDAETSSQQASTVAAAAEEATATAQSVAGASSELTKAIQEISSSAGEAADGSHKAAEQAERTRVTMNTLDEAAQKIGEIITLITGVAEQTNLLALNATIEAARAGDAGKGFAVVASEVKSLAGQTAKATDEISEQINNIQTVVKSAVEAIEDVARSVDRVNGVSTSISAAVEEQNAATAEISRNTEQTAQSAGSVSQTIVGVLSSVQSTASSAQGLVESSDDLGRQADKLREDVAQFLKRLRAA